MIMIMIMINYAYDYYYYDYYCYYGIRAQLQLNNIVLSRSIKKLEKLNCN